MPSQGSRGGGWGGLLHNGRGVGGAGGGGVL